MHKLNKEVPEMTKEEYKYTQTPIGNATYKHNIKKGRPITNGKVSPKDRIICDICGKEYTRSGSAGHKKTVYHKERQRINKKLRELLMS